MTDEVRATVAQRIAEAARAFELRRTGHEPQSVTVLLNEDTLVITLRGGLSPAELALAQTPAGATKVQEFHRQLFASSSDWLRREVAGITGVQVREASAEVRTGAGSVQVFTDGTVVEVFLLARSVPADSWSSRGPDGQAQAPPPAPPGPGSDDR